MVEGPRPSHQTTSVSARTRVRSDPEGQTQGVRSDPRVMTTVQVWPVVVACGSVPGGLIFRPLIVTPGAIARDRRMRDEGREEFAICRPHGKRKPALSCNGPTSSSMESKVADWKPRRHKWLDLQWFPCGNLDTPR
jgi:hypothetical protein